MQCTSAAIPRLPNQPSTFGRFTARPAPTRWFSHVGARTHCSNYTTWSREGARRGREPQWSRMAGAGLLLRAWQAWQA